MQSAIAQLKKSAGEIGGTATTISSGVPNGDNGAAEGQPLALVRDGAVTIGRLVDD